jgi:Tfp pilus assembly protein PilO
MIWPGAWGRHWWAWAVPSLVLVANLAWIVGFRTAVLQRGTALGSQVEQLQSEVARLETTSRKLTEMRSRLDGLRTDLDTLRRDQLSGMRSRLVPFLQEVVRLGDEAGLKAERVSYSYSKDAKSGLVYFTASYAVKGTYEQIRRCVYLMETSPQFIVLEGLALRGDSSSTSLEISVQLTMGTYFSEVDEALIQELGVKEVRVGSQD